MTFTNVPTVNLGDCKISDVSDAISTLGFLSVKSWDLPTPDQIARMFDISSNFFLNESEIAKSEVMPAQAGN